MSQFKKKLKVFGASLALLTFSTTPVLSFNLEDQVLGKTGNMNVTDGFIQGSAVTGGHEISITGASGAVGQVDFKNFHVDAGDTLNYAFSNTSQTIINRVLGGSESQILGKITNSCADGTCSNNFQSGKVILINPAGMLFGTNSRVDLNSFTASTNDIKGIKNLKDMADMDTYQSTVLNKFSPIASVNDEGNTYGIITFDRANTSEFLSAGEGITTDQLNGQRVIRMNGTTMTHFNDINAGTYDDTNGQYNNINKTLAFFGDGIKYTDSLLRTGSNKNYISESSEKSLGNVSIVTADGIKFKYVASGYGEAASDASGNALVSNTSNVVKYVDMNNSGLTDKDAIVTGDVKIWNYSNNPLADGSQNLKIKNSAIKATKLTENQYGEIDIMADKDVLIDNSKLITANTSWTNVGTESDPVYKTKILDNHALAVDGNNTYNDSYGDPSTSGKITVRTVGKLNITGSELETAGSTNEAYDSAVPNFGDRHSGDIYIQSGDDLKIATSTTDANGNITIIGQKNIEADTSTIYAKNEVVADDTNFKTDVNIYSLNTSGADVKIKDSLVASSRDINIEAFKNDAGNRYNSGNVKITATNPDKTLVRAENNLTILGENTEIDNAAIAYNTIKFVDTSRTLGKNNVTVKNEASFDPKGSDDIYLETNGNFTLSNATVKKSTTSIAKNATKPIHTFAVSKKNADNVTIKSTEESIYTKDYNDTNTLETNKDVNLISYKSIKLGKPGESNIDNTTRINAGQNLNITSTNGDITGEKTEMPGENGSKGQLKYGQRLKFDAKGNNIFTSKNSLKSVNVDYVAGNGNKFYTEKDIQFVDSTLEAKSNFIESGKDVILNNTEIKVPTGVAAKSVTTDIYANGNVTTEDITGTLAADRTAPHQYPQSVSTDRVTGTPGSTALNINQSKLRVTTEVVKDATNPDNGSITLNVKNADNKDAGLELVAQNVANLDDDPTGGDFKTGYYHSGPQKWDEKIEQKEGPEVKVNATDDKLAISKIVTDKLTLDTSDKIIGSPIDPSKLTDAQKAQLPEGQTDPIVFIEVRDQGGFNMDTDPGHGDNYTPGGTEGQPDSEGGFKYVDDYNKTTDTNTTTTINPFPEDGWVETGRTPSPDGTKIIITYERTTDGKTETTTVVKETAHKIVFDNEDPSNPDVILVYDKTNTTTTEENFQLNQDKDGFIKKDDGTPITPGTIKDPDDPTQPLDPSKLVETKTEEEDIPPGPGPGPVIRVLDSLIDRVRLPRQQMEVSKTSSITDNTKDHTSGIMNSAKKVEIDEETN